jgi:hypothetical protein
MYNIDYKKLKKDLLKKVSASGIMPLIVSVDSADEKELILLAEEFKIDLSKYKNIER